MSREVSAKELDDLYQQGPVSIIDVREPVEFMMGHIPGSKNIPLNDVSKRLSEIDPTIDNYIICHSGARSKAAVDELAKNNIDAINVKDGIMHWHGKMTR